MKKIPDALRSQMDADPWMHRCAITGTRSGKIDWHHNLIFAGSQVNEVWAILPLLKEIHDAVPGDPELKDLCDWIMLNRATDDQLRPYCKAINYIARRAMLNKKFGGPYVGKVIHFSTI